VFPSPAATGTPDAKDPISIKKQEKGDGRWDTKKELLGYMLNGIARTVQIPQDQAEDLLKEIRNILRKQRISPKRFRSIAGRLQHAAQILPAAQAFFTPINLALCGMPSYVGLNRNGKMRHALIDVVAVICNLAHRPTQVSKLVQGSLDYTGYCNASTFGAREIILSVVTPSGHRISPRASSPSMPTYYRPSSPTTIESLAPQFRLALL
jgi:hypothetical protein